MSGLLNIIEDIFTVPVDVCNPLLEFTDTLNKEMEGLYHPPNSAAVLGSFQVPISIPVDWMWKEIKSEENEESLCSHVRNHTFENGLLQESPEEFILPTVESREIVQIKIEPRECDALDPFPEIGLCNSELQLSLENADKNLQVNPLSLPLSDNRTILSVVDLFKERGCISQTHKNVGNNDRLIQNHQCFHTMKRQVTCELCNKKFHCQVQLLLHKRKHDEEKTFKCDLCGATFDIRNKLVLHQVNTHMKLNVYSCDLCPKRFGGTTELKRHKLIHTGEKPFKCELCGKAFVQKPHLSYHMTVHTKIKAFSCSQCTKKFNRKCDLESHLRKHTGERPYKCKLCNKSYMLKHHLTSHIINIHKN